MVIRLGDSFSIARWWYVCVYWVGYENNESAMVVGCMDTNE